MTPSPVATGSGGRGRRMADNPVRPVRAIDDPHTLAKAGRMIRLARARRQATTPPKTTEETERGQRPAQRSTPQP